MVTRVYLIPVALAVFEQAAVNGNPDSSVTKAAQYGTLAIQFWMIVKLGFVPGTKGPNEYGEDLAASQPAYFRFRINPNDCAVRYRTRPLSGVRGRIAFQTATG